MYESSLLSIFRLSQQYFFHFCSGGSGLLIPGCVVIAVGELGGGRRVGKGAGGRCVRTMRRTEIVCFYKRNSKIHFLPQVMHQRNAIFSTKIHKFDQLDTRLEINAFAFRVDALIRGLQIAQKIPRQYIFANIRRDSNFHNTRRDFF